MFGHILRLANATPAKLVMQYYFIGMYMMPRIRSPTRYLINILQCIIFLSLIVMNMISLKNDKQIYIVIYCILTKKHAVNDTQLRSLSRKAKLPRCVYRRMNGVGSKYIILNHANYIIYYVLCNDHILLYSMI